MYLSRKTTCFSHISTVQQRNKKNGYKLMYQLRIKTNLLKHQYQSEYLLLFESNFDIMQQNYKKISVEKFEHICVANITFNTNCKIIFVRVQLVHVLQPVYIAFIWKIFTCKKLLVPSGIDYFFFNSICIISKDRFKDKQIELDKQNSSKPISIPKCIKNRLFFILFFCQQFVLSFFGTNVQVHSMYFFVTRVKLFLLSDSYVNIFSLLCFLIERVGCNGYM